MSYIPEISFKFLTIIGGQRPFIKDDTHSKEYSYTALQRGFSKNIKHFYASHNAPLSQSEMSIFSSVIVKILMKAHRHTCSVKDFSGLLHSADLKWQIPLKENLIAILFLLERCFSIFICRPLCMHHVLYAAHWYPFPHLSSTALPLAPSGPPNPISSAPMKAQERSHPLFLLCESLPSFIQLAGAFIFSHCFSSRIIPAHLYMLLSCHMSWPNFLKNISVCL